MEKPDSSLPIEITENTENRNDAGAFQRFDALVRKVLSVSHEEIMRREAEYKKQSLANPNRRGPKVKAKKRKAR